MDFIGVYNTKQIKSKNFTEYIFNLDGTTPTECNRKQSAQKRKFEDLTALEKSESIQRREKYYQDKRFEIKRIIDCNYDDKSTFLTLTFKENLQDIEQANKEFTLFIKRLKYYLKKDIRYIATWELQKRGAIHYHMVGFSLPYIEANKLKELWRNGFIKVNKIKESVKKEAVAVYITKYFAKDLDKKAMLKKAYFCSRNLTKPVQQKKYLTLEQINKILINENILYAKKFISKQFIGALNGQKLFEDVEKIYVVKKNTNKIYCKKIKDMLEFNEKDKKEVKLVTS